MLYGAFSLTLAAVATYLLYLGLPDRLEVTTDVVGYPTHHNFDVDRYFNAYFLAVVVLPATAFAVSWILRRVFPPQLRTFAVPTRHVVAVRPLCRAAFIGTVFGLLVALSSGRTSFAFWGIAGAVAAAYVLVGFLLARVLPRVGSAVTADDRLAALNTLAAPWLVLGLCGPSAATEVMVGSTQTVRQLSWMPLWLGGCVAIALFIAVAITLRRAATPLALRRLEAQAIVLIAGPVLVFLLHTTLPSPVGSFDAFHDGEYLVGADLVRAGRFPWRDVIFIHGLLGDVFQPLVGMTLFEDSVWGARAGYFLLLSPVWFLGLYFFHAYLFRRDWLFLALTVALGTSGFMSLPNLRFVLQPFVLLLFAVLLQRPSAISALAFTALLLTQTIITPESAYLVAACGVVLVAYEVLHGSPGSFRSRFRRTALCAAWGLFLSAGFVAWLWHHRALGAFVDYYRAFAPDHRLAGGIPLDLYPNASILPPAPFLVIAPPLCMLLAIWHVARHLRARRPLTSREWVITAETLFLFLFYQKFLARADSGHAAQVVFAGASVLYYTLYKLTKALEVGLPRLSRRGRLVAFTRRPVTLVLLVLVLALGPSSLAAQLDQLTTKLRLTVAEPPWLDRLGYATPHALDPAVYREIQELFDAHTRPDDRFFDFTNQPGLLFYLLRRTPATRYYDVGMAMRPVVQRDIVRQLRTERPEIVVFSSNRFGMGAWDAVPNMVRHYELSQYLLEAYRPLVAAHGYMLMKRADLADIAETSASAGLDGRYFQTDECAWGFAPNFFTHEPNPGNSGRPPIDLTFTTSAPDDPLNLHLHGWAMNLATDRPATAVLVVHQGKVIGSLPVDAARPDVAAGLGRVAAGFSGFNGHLSLAEIDRATLPDLRVFAQSEDGDVSELIYGPAVVRRPPSGENVSVLDLGERGIAHVMPGKLSGYVDGIEQVPPHVTHIALPRALRGGGYGVLEIDAVRWPEDAFAISDERLPSTRQRVISFSSLDRARTRLRIPLANCSQWYGYGGDVLYLRHGEPLEITAMRLLPGPLAAEALQ